MHIDRLQTYPSSARVCIVGLGPAGIATALRLSDSNLSQGVVCLEQGTTLSSRSCSVLRNGICTQEQPCQMITGIGGSSLLSGGKVSAFPAGSQLATILGGNENAEKRLGEAIGVIGSYVPLRAHHMTPGERRNATESFRKLGFNYKYFDVHQFDHEELREGYQRICSRLEARGTTLLAGAELTGVEHLENAFSLTLRKDNCEFNIVSECLVLAIGRSGQGIARRLNSRLGLGGKDGQMEIGVRLVFPTELLPEMARCHLDVKLHFNNARTFCVCLEGKLAPYILDEVFFCEGYSGPRSQTGLTNLGLMTRLGATSDNGLLLSDIKGRSRRQSDGKLTCQVLTEYLSPGAPGSTRSAHTEGYGSYWLWGNVNECFPPTLAVTITEAVRYFSDRLLPRSRWDEVRVFAPEADYGGLYFPVDSNFSLSPGLYVAGDCTGQFRGIAQAFCSGIVCGEGILGYLDDR